MSLKMIAGRDSCVSTNKTGTHQSKHSANVGQKLHRAPLNHSVVPKKISEVKVFTKTFIVKESFYFLLKLSNKTYLKACW